jgi:hypothetical protein
MRAILCIVPSGGTLEVFFPEHDDSWRIEELRGSLCQEGPEETAAMRSQANNARLLDGSPTLMRLRELEVLEKIATRSKLNVVLGERGLAERVVYLL